ncbi:MAG: DUF3179 domain-containing (seleno)protein [Myxococcota bacterium]|nr:DUF3179 domain-containing (seleno)protein [Myxococcota bacterium]
MRGLVLGLLFASLPAGAADELNGFSVDGASVPAGAILAGGPARDGIRSVDEPRFVGVEAATWAADDTQVIGLEIDGDARAYPVHLLEYHQVVNDEFSGQPVVVTYDPIAGTPIAFDARVDGEPLQFGVSGLLYESNFLLYDRGSESLWSQLLGLAVSGPKQGTRLRRIRSRQEAFVVWRHRHPETRVLERPLPRRIDYRYSRFHEYWISDTVPFPVSVRDDRFHPKAGVLGVVAGDKARAYLGPVLTAAGGRIVDEFEGHRIRIAYDVAASSFSWEIPDEIEVTDAYWFAWKTFHRDTEVWQPEADQLEEAE